MIEILRSMKSVIGTGSLLVALTGCSPDGGGLEPAAHVNPFIGTSGGENFRHAGNTVPGAVMPFGMLSFGPETAFTEDLLENARFRKMVVEKSLRVPVSAGGYNWAASRIKGFSLTRLSGTGCLGASGDIPFLPFIAEITHSPDTDKMDRYYSVGFSHTEESARPGYYRVLLDNGVDVQLTATERTGIARLTYPPNETAGLLVRAAYSQLGSGDAYSQVDMEKGEVTGYVTSGNFCGYLGDFNRRDYYTLYFVAHLDHQILASGAWQDDQLRPGATEARGGMPYGDEGVPPLGKGSGVWLELDTSSDRVVNLKVAISYVSIENARLNLATEQTDSDTLESVSQRAYQAWNDSLSKIRVRSENEDLLTTFYSALYHTQFHPNLFSDVNGEYAGFDGAIHKTSRGQTAQYANFSGWDVYRSQLQLLAMLHRERANDIAQSLLNQAVQNGGVWDRWTHNSGPTGVMSGDPSTIAMAGFVAFGADDFEVKKAYDSLVRAARHPTELDLSNEGCPVFCRGQRASLDQWLDLGYISDLSNSWEGASETLEQASADFALSQLALHLGETDDHREFLARSGNWRNLFNPEATEDRGYIQGRLPDGSWKAGFDPADEALFVEGSPSQYLWMIPFDGVGLTDLLGGSQKTVERLDHLFKTTDGDWALTRAGGAHADLSNQPSINSPFMYLFTEEPSRTSLTVRKTLEQLWHHGPNGIPGQDDLGQMSSWYVFTALGLYPLFPGNADLVLSSPLFEDSEIQLANGVIRIHAEGAADKIYVHSVNVDGRTSLASWLDRSWLEDGMSLDMTLSSEPNPDWGRGPKNRPSSYPPGVSGD
jgi:predicted alpha-1,2-mannosidase